MKLKPWSFYWVVLALVNLPSLGLGAEQFVETNLLQERALSFESALYPDTTLFNSMRSISCSISCPVNFCQVTCSDEERCSATCSAEGYAGCYCW